MRTIRLTVSRLWGNVSATPDMPFNRRSMLFAILAGAFVLRLGMALRLPTIHYADEVFQVAEPANRSVNGFGIVSWEFQARARPALLPTLVQPIYRLHVSATAHRVLQAALLSALSLIPVWIAFAWAGRLYGLQGAVIASVLMATWFELVYFAPKPLADVVSSYALIAAVYLARPLARRRELFLAGCALVLTVGIRPQLTPAVAVVSLLALLVGERGRLINLAAGAIAGLTVVGVADYAWWGAPFEGLIGYLRANIAQNASGYFGHEAVGFYLKQYILMLGAGIPVFALLVWIGARRAPVLLIAMIAIVAPFHFIPHKEYRFVVAAAPIYVLSLGLAASDLVARLAASTQRQATLVLVGAWLVAMSAVCYGDYYRPLWTRYGNHVLAFEEVGRDPEACGVALVGIRWYHTPGESGIGRDVPIYEVLRDDQKDDRMREANYFLMGTKQPPPPAPYVQMREYARPSEVLYRRPGGCVPDPASRIARPDSGMDRQSNLESAISN